MFATLPSLFAFSAFILLFLAAEAFSGKELEKLLICHLNGRQAKLATRQRSYFSSI